MPEFKLDALDQTSNFHIVFQGVKMSKREVVETPRVGLTLKRLDEHRPAYWLADYRHLVFPEFHSKMKDFIILSMIDKGIAASSIAQRANCKIGKIEELRQDFNKDKKADTTLTKLHKENMKAADWAEAYGLSKKLYSK